MEIAALAVSVIALLVAGFSGYNTLRSRQAAQASATTAQAALKRQERIDHEEAKRVHFTRKPGHGKDAIVVTQDGPGTAHDVTFSRKLLPENGRGNSASTWPKGHAEGFGVIPASFGDRSEVPSVTFTDSDGTEHTQPLV